MQTFIVLLKNKYILQQLHFLVRILKLACTSWLVVIIKGNSSDNKCNSCSRSDNGNRNSNNGSISTNTNNSNIIKLFR